MGRDDQLAVLWHFAKGNAASGKEWPLLWCVVSGPAGSGKSRLAREFAKQLSEQDGWGAGFLRHDDKTGKLSWDLADAALWSPSKNTLIIVDYAQFYGRELRSLLLSMISRVQSSQDSDPAPIVRLLLIDRQGGLHQDVSWLKSFLEGYGVRDVQGERALTKHRFQRDASVDLPGEIALPSLPSSCLLSVAADHADREAAALTDSECTWVSRFITETQGDPRPLMAAIAGELLRIDPNYRSTDLYEVLCKLLDAQRRNYLQARSVSVADILYHRDSTCAPGCSRR